MLPIAHKAAQIPHMALGKLPVATIFAQAVEIKQQGLASHNLHISGLEITMDDFQEIQLMKQLGDVFCQLVFLRGIYIGISKKFCRIRRIHIFRQKVGLPTNDAVALFQQGDWCCSCNAVHQ